MTRDVSPAETQQSRWERPLRTGLGLLMLIASAWLLAFGWQSVAAVQALVGPSMTSTFRRPGAVGIALLPGVLLPLVGVVGWALRKSLLGAGVGAWYCLAVLIPAFLSSLALLLSALPEWKSVGEQLFIFVPGIFTALPFMPLLVFRVKMDRRR